MLPLLLVPAANTQYLYQYWHLYTNTDTNTGIGIDGQTDKYFTNPEGGIVSYDTGAYMKLILYIVIKSALVPIATLSHIPDTDVGIGTDTQ